MPFYFTVQALKEIAHKVVTALSHALTLGGQHVLVYILQLYQVFTVCAVLNTVALRG